MALGLERAIAEVLRDGDPARTIDGLDTLRSFRLYDDADTAKRKIFVNEEPTAPDECVTVFLEGGRAPIGGGPPNSVGLRPSFTVRVRSTTSEAAQAIAREAYAILDLFEGTVRGIGIFRVFADFEPVPLGRDRGDAGGRWIFSQTFRSITKRYVLS